MGQLGINELPRPCREGVFRETQLDTFDASLMNSWAWGLLVVVFICILVQTNGYGHFPVALGESHPLTGSIGQRWSVDLVITFLPFS